MPLTHYITVPCEVCNGDGCKHCEHTGEVRMRLDEWYDRHDPVTGDYQSPREQFHSDLGLSPSDDEPYFPGE